MFGDLGKMFKAASEMRRRWPQVQEKLASTRYTAQAGDGAVIATVNGKLLLVELRISPQAIASADAARLAELVQSAVTAAQQQAATAAVEAMKEITGGMELPDDLKGVF